MKTDSLARLSSWLWECPALTLFHALGIFSCYETRCLSFSWSSLGSEGHFGMSGALLLVTHPLSVCQLSAAGLLLLHLETWRKLSLGEVGSLGGGWRIWAWPLLTNHKVGEVIV